LQLLLLALLGYLSYLLADAADLSPILSLFFCGVTMSHYSWHSLGPAAQALAVHTFRVSASTDR
jgi:NhaP-type Na+/H+ or K+/H+ antiporter